MWIKAAWLALSKMIIAVCHYWTLQQHLVCSTVCNVAELTVDSACAFDSAETSYSLTEVMFLSRTHLIPVLVKKSAQTFNWTLLLVVLADLSQSCHNSSDVLLAELWVVLDHPYRTSTQKGEGLGIILYKDERVLSYTDVCSMIVFMHTSKLSIRCTCWDWLQPVFVDADWITIDIGCFTFMLFLLQMW